MKREKSNEEEGPREERRGMYSLKKGFCFVSMRRKR